MPGRQLLLGGQKASSGHLAAIVATTQCNTCNLLLLHSPLAVAAAGEASAQAAADDGVIVLVGKQAGPGTLSGSTAPAEPPGTTSTAPPEPPGTAVLP